MINMKKITAILLVVGLTCNSYNITSTVPIHAEEATTYEQASVVTIDNLDEYDSKAVLSWSTELVSTENGKKVSSYASFTLKEDSIVKMGVKYTATVGSAYISPAVFLYTNEAMTNKKLEFGQYANQGKPKTVYLPAGTYYIEATDEKQPGWVHGAKVDVSVCALPVDKALSAVSKLDKNKSKATVTVKHALGADLGNLQYVYGAYDEKDNLNHNIWKTPITNGFYYRHIATQLTGGNTFTVKKNGTYTIRVITNDWVAYSIQHKVKGLDNTAPKITGVKNGKTYKKAVTIGFSDKGSGIKSAKLNGKTIKSGKKISKKGKYTLKVTDKAGNTKIVKFTIRK